MVIYESVYGNTESVAKAVADRLSVVGEVTLARFGEVPQRAVEDADLVVLGGPTHGWGMTRPASRQRPNAEGYAVGAREWLEGSSQGEGRMAAAFDTRFGKPRWLTGSAALRIARRLGRNGYRLVARPESFFVLHTEGPLRDGEEDRARRGERISPGEHRSEAQAAEKPHAAYKPVRKCGKADAHGIALTSTSRSFSRSGPSQEPDS